MDLGALWVDYAGPLCTAIGGVGGWCANMGRVYLSAQRGRLDAGQQALAILDRASARDARMDDLLGALTGRISDLMRQRWHSDDVLQDLYAQAISARLTVHELDARAGQPPRQFPPLPPYPYLPTEDAAHRDDPEAGAAAVDAAEPRADSTHG
jgi:hypothetical protein